MYSIDSFTGADLPDKTLCITFDDGPGEHTYEIGKFLFEENISATFFVVGKYAYQHPDILQSLKDFGHLIGNHTYEHPDMPYYRSVNGDIPDQIIRTDLVIKKYINSDTTYFRSPYGKWSAEVASDLNSNLLTTLGHVGPIYWDMGGIDCYFWQLDRSVEDAVSGYYNEILEKKKGIILFHDDIADMDYVKPRNKTLQLLQLLIPKLKTEGYKFVGLETIESITKASKKNLSVYLKINEYRYLSLKKNNDVNTCYVSKKNQFDEFIIERLTHGKIAIQSVNGFYLNVQENNDNLITANKKEIEPDCLFDWIPVRGNQFILRATNGNYLTFNKEDDLVANAKYMRKSHIFSYSLTNAPAKTSLTFAKRMALIKKRLLYIKSKILQA